jgi:hypothetical protein
MVTLVFVANTGDASDATHSPTISSQHRQPDKAEILFDLFFRRLMMASIREAEIIGTAATLNALIQQPFNTIYN